MPGFTTHDHCVPLAGKWLRHQMILQPTAIPARFSFPMDPPASAFPMPRAPWAKEHRGMCVLTPHPPAPHNLPPNIFGLNQLLLLILPPKTAGNHPPQHVQTRAKTKEMPARPGRCLCPLDQVTPGCQAQSKAFRQLSCARINCFISIAVIKKPRLSRCFGNASPALLPRSKGS